MNIGYCIPPDYTMTYGPTYAERMREGMLRLYAKRVTPDARDAAWIERELGDVPVRVMGETCHDNPQEWAALMAVGRSDFEQRDYAYVASAPLIPIESLGRE